MDYVARKDTEFFFFVFVFEEKKKDSSQDLSNWMQREKKTVFYNRKNSLGTLCYNLVIALILSLVSVRVKIIIKKEKKKKENFQYNFEATDKMNSFVPLILNSQES